MDDLIKKLANAEFFGKFPESDRVALAKLALPRRLRAGEYSCFQGDLWPNVLFLAEGSLDWVMISVSGKEHVLFSLSPNDVFWGHSIFDDKPMPASLKATETSVVYRWEREAILPILYRHPETLWEVAGMLTGTMRKAREIIYGLAFQPVAGRLASLLLDRFSDPEDISVERDLTLNAIASRVASSPEVVCRVLHQFQAEGVLEVTRATITLHDRSALEDLMEPE
ncbi:MAG: Crp/Fnr family transcriptional regulator [Anaerolineae bacterium]|jgi:CRP-like cAMP-binding protein|nr:Crp/Fnr family transcriptional regulator [Anaerolineae bacterium]MBT7783083.1 Crp/Fnr family transcriptional regulator [Anaerolineae bacterium]